MRIGTDNKRQMYLLIGLIVVLFGAGGYELYRMFGGGSSYTPPPPAVPQYRAGVGVVTAVGPDAQKLTNNGLDPTLHLGAAGIE